MKLGSRRGLAFIALAAMGPLAILAACGNATFSPSAADSDASSDSGDAAVAPDSPSGTWCQVNAAGALACADFDESDSGDLQTGYSRNVPTPLFIPGSAGDDGGLAIVGNGISHPNALSVHLREVGLSETDHETLTATIVGSRPEAFTFNSMIRFDDGTVLSSVASPLNVCAIVLTRTDDGGPQSSTAIALQIFNSKLHLAVGNGSANQLIVELGALTPTETWIPFSISVTTGTSGTISASFGTSTAPSAQINVQPGVATIVLGLDSKNGDTRPTSISYDNVTLVADTADGG